MLLFQKRFHEGLLSGSITLTFRRWEKPLVRPGGRYRCHPIGVLEVDAIEVVRVSDIDASAVLAAGFATHDELLVYLRDARPDERLTPKTKVFRVRLHHGGDGDRVAIALDAELDKANVSAIRAKLAGLDARSTIGPWTRKTLRLIAKHPRVAASKLAQKLGRDRDEFKADVVKLKKLGLTQSFEVGYELSPRGAAYMARTTRARLDRPDSSR